MRISLRQLQIFTAIAESGSTNAAAERIALSQSAASAGLNELEGLLQVKLFDRVGKRLLLNDNGRLLLPQAKQMLDAALSIEAQFAIADTDISGLKIGASTTIGIYLLPAILAATSDQQTSLSSNVMIANTADIAAAVERFDIDMGLVEGPCHQPELVVEPWRRDELLIVTAPAHPILGKENSAITREALQNAGWLLRESGSGTRDAVEHALTPHLHALRTAGVFSNAEAIKHAAAAGLGLACLSHLVVRDFLDMGKLVQLQTDLPPLGRHFYLIYNRRKILSERLKNFLHFCRNHVT